MTMTKPTSEQVTFTEDSPGAIQRTVMAKLRDAVSVRDFGAVGDGVVDDTAALQEAFNFATDNRKSLWFPGGTYRVTATITINQNNSANLFAGAGDALIQWLGANTVTDMLKIYNAWYVTFYKLKFQGPSNVTLVNMRGDPLGFPRPDGKGARGAAFLNCIFLDGRIALRWTTKDVDFNNEQGRITNCYFADQFFASVSIEHSNSLWHRICGCEFDNRPGAWAINTVDDQNGNSYANPANDPGYGGSGIFADASTLVGGGLLRAGAMRWPIQINGLLAEGNNDFIYTPTGKQTFTASITSGNTTVTNVTNPSQLAPNDYFWNRHVPIGTKIVSIDVPNQTVLLDTAPTGTQASSICDAGIYTLPAGSFALFIDNARIGWNPANPTVNPLIALDLASASGVQNPMFVKIANSFLQSGNATQPMFMLAETRRGTVVMSDIYGEPAPFKITNCDVTSYGLWRRSGAGELLSPSSTLQASAASSRGFTSNCLVSGSTMFTQMSIEESSSTQFIPYGDLRIMSATYPASPTTITAISGIAQGNTVTIQFGGQITLQHSATLQLQGSADVRPPLRGSITFQGLSNGARELSRDFDTYRANVTDTAANIASIAAAVNTTGKYSGKVVWDSTNNRLMRASGAAANSAWYVIDGSASVTPA